MQVFLRTTAVMPFPALQDGPEGVLSSRNQKSLKGFKITVLPASETERKIKGWRQQLLDELVQLAKSTEGTPDQREQRALQVLEELRVTDNVLATIEPQRGSGPYSQYTDPSEAVAAYLRDRGSPARMQEIIDGVFAGGYRGGHKTRTYALTVKLAIHNRFTAQGRRREDLALKGDKESLIGLMSWPDELFSPDQDRAAWMRAAKAVLKSEPSRKKP